MHIPDFRALGETVIMDNEEIFTTSFQAGRKRIYVDVKENHAGTYLKIKERGDSQSNSIGHGARRARPARAGVLLELNGGPEDGGPPTGRKIMTDKIN